MGLSGICCSNIHITVVEHAHVKRHDPGQLSLLVALDARSSQPALEECHQANHREERIDEPLEVGVADLERQLFGSTTPGLSRRCCRRPWP